MDTDIGRAIKNLAQSRQTEIECRHNLAEIEEDADALIQERYGSDLGNAASLLSDAQARVARDEATVRERGLATYYATENKRLHPAAEVKLYTILDYEKARALAYCQQFLPSAFTMSKPVLNRQIFEKAAKVLTLPFVTITMEPRVFITKDLSEYVGGQDES